jgi:AcrR family transcriptional regulator
MNDSYKRKKQPQLVRSQLLEAAAHVTIERGLGGLTLDLVAQRAGVSKGGLIHHFASKQALIEGLFNELMCAFEDALNACMAKDPEPRGRFFRAYIAATLQPCYGSYDSKLLGACALAMASDKTLSDFWQSWLQKQLQKYEEDSNLVLALMVRYAADGMWLENCTLEAPILSEQRKAVAEYLVKLTYTL